MEKREMNRRGEEERYGKGKVVCRVMEREGKGVGESFLKISAN